MTEAAISRGTLTGGKVLAILFGFFGVIFAVNILMAYDAISTFRGEVAPHPYEAGLAFNTEIAAAEAQTARRWKVDVALGSPLSATFRDADGQPLAGLTVTATFAAPADARLDKAFALREIGPGVYVADAAIPRGVSDLKLLATRDGQTLFQSQNRVSHP